jgi:hypothetical protein
MPRLARTLAKGVPGDLRRLALLATPFLGNGGRIAALAHFRSDRFCANCVKLLQM